MNKAQKSLAGVLIVIALTSVAGFIGTIMALPIVIAINLSKGPAK